MSLKPEKSINIIRPCPFCLGEELGHAYIKIKGEPDRVVIACSNCGASGPVCVSGYECEEIAKADDKAIQQWNSQAHFKPTQKVKL